MSLDTANVVVNAQEIWEYAERTLTAGSGLDEGQLHTALDSYANKDAFKADLAGLTAKVDAIPDKVWSYTI